MDRLYSVARNLWDEEFFTQTMAESIFPLLMEHRLHRDDPWHTSLDKDSYIYLKLFCGKNKEDYKWLTEPGNNVMIFNKLVKDKKDNIELNWEMFKKLVILASLSKSNIEPVVKARTSAIDIIESVHPSGIQEILKKNKNKN